jgi:hypothetical protein
MGDVVEFPLRVLRPRATSVARRWEAAFGRTGAQNPASAGHNAPTIPEGILAGAQDLGPVPPTG